MLLLVRSPSELKYSQLMEVYLEDNLETARRQYGHLPEYEALACAEQDFYSYLTDVFLRTEKAFCAFWTPEGDYRAALRLEPYRDGFLLTGVSTAPPHRRKGYAGTLLRQVLERMPEGSKIYSHVEKSNAPSISLHEKCGFVPVLDHAHMLDGSVLHNFCTFLYGK